MPASSVVDDVVEEAVAVHPARRLELAGEQQLARGALAQHLGQQQRAGVGGAEADADLGRGVARAVGADAQVAGGGELERAADADAVDGGDHGDERLEHDLGEALELVDRGGEAVDVGRRRPRTGRRRREKSSPAPRATRQRTPGSRPAASSASAIAAIVSRPHALRWRWLSQLMIAGGAEFLGGDAHRSPLWSSDGVRQFVAAGGAEDLRASCARRRAGCRARARARRRRCAATALQRARRRRSPRRRRAAAATIGSPSATIAWRAPSSSSPIACG